MADIFSKVVGGLNKGVAMVGANSKAMVEKARINTAIENMEDEKKQLAEILGMKVYEMYTSNGKINTADIERLISEINNRLKLIAEQQKQLRHVEAELSIVMGSGKAYSLTCECGADNPSGSRFCANCGSSL